VCCIVRARATKAACAVIDEAVQIFGGTSEIQQLIIARDLLRGDPVENA
jgi:alkylation response protein AidB-like acyl-CoA dehydrogenase